MSSLKGALSEAMKENKKLEEKQEYQPKGSQIDPEGLHDYMKEEIDKLKEENKNLKDQVFHGTTKDEIKEIYRVTMKLNEEKKKLEEENKKLKEEVREYEYESNESGVKEKKLYEQLFSFQAENKKLQEEINHKNKMFEEWGEENKKLQEDLLHQKKVAFWRMAESYAGYDKNTCIHDEDWCNEVKESMEEYYGSDGEELGSIDELLEGYKDWIGVVPWE